MFSTTQLASRYIRYWLKGENAKGHGVHSPYVFDLITSVFNDKEEYECYRPIEELRSALRKDGRVLQIRDFGAGSKVNNKDQRSVHSIASSALKPKRFGQLLYRIAKYHRYNSILELGTSLGITTSYLASSDPAAKVITLEGADTVAAVAEENFSQLGLKNIEVVTGDFRETLSSVLEKAGHIDLAFIDGDHRKDPTIENFHKILPYTDTDSMMIFDDIHWSQEMEAAWEYIKQHEAVTLTIDLFYIGIVLFRKEQLHKQHFIVRF